jgi:NAD(P)H-dependent FMN reductase
MESQNQQTGSAEPVAPRPSVLVVSASLNPNSRSYRLAESAADALGRLGAEATLIDLRKWDLPLCDGDKSYSHPAVEKLTQLIRDAGAALLAAPIYNYDLNAAAKNLIELTGDAWNEKPVGFLCSAGGKSSYMSPIGLANSLMFDFRCWVVPRFVYATRQDFDETRRPSPQINERIEQLAKATLGLARALQWMSNPQGTAEKSAYDNQS